MILKSLKEKTAKKKLDKILSQTAHGGQLVSKIKTVGIISEASREAEVARLRAYFEKLGIHPNQIYVISYHPEPTERTNAFTHHFNGVDFGWKGKILNDALSEFLQRPYDLMINYYSNDELWAAKLASALSNNQIAAGLATIDPRVNDIGIDCKPEDLDTFTTELEKYLRALNCI